METQYPALFEYKEPGNRYHLVAMFTDQYTCVIKKSKWSSYPVGLHAEHEDCGHSCWKPVKDKWVDVFGVMHDKP